MMVHACCIVACLGLVCQLVEPHGRSTKREKESETRATMKSSTYNDHVKML